MTIPAKRPFRAAAEKYRARGFLGTLPLPPRAKEPPPDGFTGHGKPYPSDVDIRRWRKGGAESNICLRLYEVPRERLNGGLPFAYAGSQVEGWALLGIDVDDYGEKRGATQLRDLETQLGSLPATVVSSARWGEAPLSGIRLFLVPRGYRYKGKASKHIDIIHAGHRYAVVWPSIHPSGSVYEFRYGTPGSDAELKTYDGIGVPSVTDVALLPEAWFTYLLSGAGDYADAQSDMEFGELEDWAEATLHGCMGEPCRLMADDLAKHVDALDESDQHHPLNTVLWRLTQNALEGHSGWYTTVRAYVDRWAEVSKSKRHPDEMGAEVMRSIDGALKKAKAMYDERGDYVPDDTCAVDTSAFDCDAWGRNMAADTEDTEAETGAHGWLSDANVSRMLVDRVLRGRYCWTPGLGGWMKWDGHRWRNVDGAKVVEQSRKFAKKLVSEAIDAGDDDKIKARLKRLSNSAIAAAANLAKGQLLVEAGEFDRHPDFLNVGNGVVDLRTGELLPPDPDLLLTKWTPTNYDRDATHADWQAALSALPADAVDWLQMRFGQAITGHTPPDDELVFLHGSGENGKTTLTLGVSKALGDHATAVPERLLLANPSDHPTELMTLRGARLAMIEELPEGRYISVSRLKNVVGKPIMKARAVHRDNVEWDATHSLFVSSNYRMLVNETDHGTWRRLLLLPFPYTYRKEHEELKGERDRRGDAGLRDRIRRSRDQQHEAILRWLVDGAVRWYANDRKMGPPPESVAEATRLWRDNCDDIAKFWSDALEAAPGRYVSSREMMTVFNDGLKEMGQKPWADRTFAERFGSHDETTKHRVYADRVYPAKSDLRASRPRLTNLGMSKDLPERLRVWVGVKFKQEYERSEGGGDQVK